MLATKLTLFATIIILGLSTILAGALYGPPLVPLTAPAQNVTLDAYPRSRYALYSLEEAAMGNSRLLYTRPDGSHTAIICSTDYPSVTCYEAHDTGSGHDIDHDPSDCVALIDGVYVYDLLCMSRDWWEKPLGRARRVYSV